MDSRPWIVDPLWCARTVTDVRVWPATSWRSAAVMVAGGCGLCAVTVRVVAATVSSPGQAGEVELVGDGLGG